MQDDPIKPKFNPPGTKRLKLKYDNSAFNFAFKFNLRRYTKEQMYRNMAEELVGESQRGRDAAERRTKVGRCSLTLSNPR